MATRSTIAIENADGLVFQVYCHWDGYLSGVGKTLLDHYTTPEQVHELISHGDISSLGTTIGTKHDFNAMGYDGTTFYGRDRGESGCTARLFTDFYDYTANHECQEYEYIMTKDGVWLVSSDGYAYTSLKDQIAMELSYD